MSYFNKGKCVRQQPLALSRRTRPPLSRLVALLARGNTRNTPDTSPFPRWKWVAFFLPFLSFCPFYPSPRCPPAWGGEAGAGPACGFVGLGLPGVRSSSWLPPNGGGCWIYSPGWSWYFRHLAFWLVVIVPQLAGLGAPAGAGPARGAAGVVVPAVCGACAVVGGLGVLGGRGGGIFPRDP